MRVATFGYDDAGPLAAPYRTRSYENGRLKSETDEHGLTTTYTYDGEGNTLTATDPLGVTSYGGRNGVRNRFSPL